MSKIKKTSFYATLPDSFEVMPRVLHQMKGLIKLHKPDKFLEDNSFGSNFRDFQS